MVPCEQENIGLVGLGISNSVSLVGDPLDAFSADAH